MLNKKNILAILILSILSISSAFAEDLLEDCVQQNINNLLEEAIETCGKAVKLEPDNGIAIMNLAQANKKAQKYQESVKYYKKYLALFEKKSDEFDTYIAEANTSVESMSPKSKEEEKLIQDQLNYLMNQGKDLSTAVDELSLTGALSIPNFTKKDARIKLLTKNFESLRKGDESLQVRNVTIKESTDQIEAIKAKGRKTPFSKSLEEKFKAFEEKAFSMHGDDAPSQIKTQRDILYTVQPELREKYLDLAMGKDAIEAGLIKQTNLTSKAKEYLEVLRSHYEQFYSNSEDVDNTMKTFEKLTSIKLGKAQEEYLKEQIIQIKRRLKN